MTNEEKFDRIWCLKSRQQTGTVSPQEQQELEDLLARDLSLAALADTLGMLTERPGPDPAQTEAACQRLLKAIK